MATNIVTKASAAASIVTHLIQGPPGAAGVSVAGTGIVHVIGGGLVSPAGPANLASNGAGGDVTGILATSNGGTGLSTIGSANQVLYSTGSALAYTSVLSLISAGSVPTSALAPGSAGQALFTSATPAAAWVSISNDIASSASSIGALSVVQITGSSGVCSVIAGTALSFAQSTGNLPTTGRLNFPGNTGSGHGYAILAISNYLNTGAINAIYTDGIGDYYFGGGTGSTFAAGEQVAFFGPSNNGIVCNSSGVSTAGTFKWTFNNTASFFDSGSNPTIGGTTADYGGAQGLLSFNPVTTLPTGLPSTSVGLFCSQSNQTLSVLANGVYLTKYTSNGAFAQASPTSDVATNTLTVQAQSAFATASTNVNGANVSLKPGASATSAGVGGSVLCNLAVPGSGTTEAALAVVRGATTLIQLQALVSSTSNGAIYGPVTPSVSNYGIAFSSSSTNVNAPSGGTIFESIAAGTVGTWTSTLFTSYNPVVVGPSNAAASGSVRLQNNVAVKARNAASSADISVISTDGSNNVNIGDATNGANVFINALANDKIALVIGSTEEIDFTDAALTWTNAVTNAPVISQTALANAGSGNGTNGLSMTVQAQAGQNATAGGSTGGNGGDLILRAGVLGTGSTTNGNPGNVRLQQGTNILVQLGTGGIVSSSTSVALTTGTVTLTQLQYRFPYIIFTGSLTGNVIVIFPTTSGARWIVDTTGVTFNAHTITWQANSLTNNTTGGGVQYLFYGGTGRLYLAALNQ